MANMESPAELRRPERNFVVQHMLGAMEAFIGRFVSVSYSSSVVEISAMASQ
jgi:hypothetical protein